ncbi:unnamed protein product [Oppiella nova]|uniref:Uncharacterized protein n=1 Tax=Oppiella nova TaxID=334625 RepID=A0A7R9LGR7_9ACAR|nr:unnamed protein product [Oppiella nova]CAG2163060.1 unnamed protein product [Oppiella nova]
MKVPIEMRKYNWITVAPPNRDISEMPVPLVHNLSETISPTSTVTAPPPPGAVVPLIAMSSNSEDYQNLLSSSALSTAKSSTFAAALRKLAKQSFDTTIGTDSGHQSALLGLTVAHSSNVSKNSNTPSFLSPYQNPAIRPSPPIVTIAPIPAHQSDRSEGLRKRDENHSYFEHRMHTDPKESPHLYTHSQRTSPIVRPSPSHIHNESLSSGGNHSTQNHVMNRSSSYQPFRSGFEESLRTNSSAALTSAPLPSHLLPYEALTFPYHQFLPQTNPNPIPHHAPHPSASYRLGDNYYLDRFGLLRGQLPGPSAPMPLTGSGTTSSVPFNLVRPSEVDLKRVCEPTLPLLSHQHHCHHIYCLTRPSLSLITSSCLTLILTLSPITRHIPVLLIVWVIITIWIALVYFVANCPVRQHRCH